MTKPPGRFSKWYGQRRDDRAGLKEYAGLLTPMSGTPTYDFYYVVAEAYELHSRSTNIPSNPLIQEEKRLSVRYNRLTGMKLVQFSI